jgi:Ca-activated chloride channel family protein
VIGTIAMLAVTCALWAQSPAAPAAPADFGTLVAEARARMEAGDFQAAAERYAAAAAARPGSAPASYNEGVALYRAGRFADAAAAFKRAGQAASEGEKTDASLEANSRFNRAASTYGATRAQAEAAERMIQTQRAASPGDAAAPGESTSAVDPKELEQAIKDAQASFEGFRDAARGAPDDLQARRNAEQSRRLLRALEELKRQQQQQEQQQQNDQQQQGDQKQPTQDDQPQDAPPTNPQDGSGDQPQEPKPAPEPQPKDGTPPEQPPKDSTARGTPREQDMTKEDADRLLQAVRDRERERRAAQEKRAQQAEARNRRPPAKDW